MSAVVMLHQRRGAKTIADGREQFNMFPKWHSTGRVWLYAVGLRDGRVKVGIARRPRERIKTYWRTHEGFDWAHLFSPLADARTARHAEVYCVSAAAKAGQRIGRSEYFRGFEKASFIAVCRAGIAAYTAAHDARVPTRKAAKAAV